MLMVRLLVYINKKPKIDDQFIFSDTIRLTELCSPLIIYFPTLRSLLLLDFFFFIIIIVY